MEFITAFVGIICAPAISALIYALHRKEAGIFEKICVYGVYAAVIRLIIAFPLYAFFRSIGAPFEDGSKQYLLLACVLALVLPYLHLIIRKYAEVRTEIVKNGKADH